MNIINIHWILLLVLFTGLMGYLLAQDTTAVGTTGKPMKNPEPLGAPSEVTKTYEPITTALPLWGNEVRAMGYQLPLPIGVGLNYAYMDHGLNLSEVRLGINNLGTEPSGVVFNNPRSKDMALVARLDAWLLPFLNFYLMGGLLNGKVNLDIDVPAIIIDDPILGEISVSDPFKIKQDVEIDGTQYGLGTMAAIGHDFYYALVDVNYSWADLDGLSQTLTALTLSPRVGIVVQSKSLPGAGTIYIGAMYMDFNATITGSISGEDLDPVLAGETLQYEVDAKPKERWNYSVGGSWEFNPRWTFFAEVGFGERKHLIMGGMFRF